MSLVRATVRNGRWAVDVVDAAGVPRSLEARFAGNARLFDYPVDARKAWRLELDKSETAASPDERDQVRAFVTACISDPGKPHVAEAWSGPTFRQAAVLELLARGQPVFGAARLKILQRWRFAAASLIATATLLASAVRASFERSDSLPPGQPWVAIFGDDATRDRLLLRALAMAPGKGPLPVLLVGRPRAGIRAVRHQLQNFQDRSYLVCRPSGLLSLLGAIPSIMRALGQGVSELDSAVAQPSTKELAGIAFRVFSGYVAAQWQRRHASPSAVIYSQTGLADVSLLELEQQRLGATTMHLVHGVSLGRNFIGFSDVAIFQCRHDASWHALMGGYSRCTHAALAPTPHIAEGEGWLLMSNLIHTMNPEYLRRGAAPELELLSAVAACAKSEGMPASEVTWKPHPSFAGQPAAIRSEVLAHVDALGFRHWPQDTGIEHAKRFRVILSTRSTVLLDLLRMGKLGILVDLSTSPTDRTATSLMPLVARDQQQLLSCVGSTARTEFFHAAYLKAWQDIGPGRTDLSLDQILEFVGNDAGAAITRMQP